MRKNQLILVGIAVIIVTVLYAFGRITPKVEKHDHDHDHEHASGGAMPSGDVAVAKFEDLLKVAKTKVPAEKLAEITALENSVVRGDVKNQQITANMQLHLLWDSLNQLPIAAYYLAEAAKLENSAKSLTFAANLFLDHLNHTQDPGVKKWEANNAMELLDKAIALNPGNDTLKLKLGSLLVSNTNEPMKGITMLLEVAEKNPDFLDAQLALANFALTSGQFDKAIERMDVVLKKNPEEPKALFLMAVAYQNKGDKAKAVELLRQCRKLIKDPSLAAEIDDYIKSI